MSSLGSPNPFFIAGKKAYEVERSLRFNDDDSPWLERTVSSSSNRRTFTISAWVKRSTLASGNIFGQTDTSGSYMFYMVFDSTHSLYILDYDYPSNNYHFVTNRKFRDPSAWYHIVLAVDTTQATNTNRSKLYINGVQETSFSTANYPAQNLQMFVNHTTYPVRIGRNGWSHTSYFDGYMAEYNFIDGLQLTPSSFGETDVLTGQWNPKKYVGSYGTNGFYLNFSTNTLGTDRSGNGNDFTPNNFSVVAGVGNDALSDTPTNNFATLNPLKTFGTYALTNGNLTVSGSARFDSVATFAVSSGKWFWEITNTDVGVAYNGILNINQFRTAPGAIGSGGVYTHYVYDGTKYRDANPSGASAYGASYTDGDIVGVALNLDDNEITFYKNGTSQGAITIPNDLYTAYLYSDSGSYNYSINFGQRAFSYTAPTGYKALNSGNLSDPTILLPNKHFDTLTYTGNGGSNSITGLQFQPDWLWIKNRGQADNHQLHDAIRGASKGLISNLSNAEYTDVNAVTAFDSNGFSMNNNYDSHNKSSETYVAWNWNAGDTDGKTYAVTVVSDSGNKYRFDGYGTSAVTLDLAEGGTYIFNYPSAHPFRFSTTADGTHGGGSEYTTGVTHNSSTQVTIVVAASAPTLYYYCSSHSGMGGQVNTNSTLGSSNFNGTIQTRVKVNATAGFSIITYTGDGTTGSTVGHGLGVKPDLIIIKRRNSSSDWMVYHKGVNAGVRPEDRYLSLNNTNAQTDSVIMLNDTAPTSSVVTLYANSAVNSSNDTYVMYCFSEVTGYSKFGSYTGNGNADGTFVFTGFRPAFILFKNSSTTTNWEIYDTKRPYGEYNPAFRPLYANHSYSEETHASLPALDILSNGFKPRSTWDEFNKNGDTIIYLAFAESPFKNARAR